MNIDKKVLIIIGVITLIFSAFLLIPKTGPVTFSPTSPSGKIVAVEKASAEVVKAKLNLYYVLNSEYPYDVVVLDEALNQYNIKKPVEEYTSVNDSIKSLKDFVYTVRGDRQAYKFTYTSVDKTIVSNEGNYKEDYQ